VGVKGKRKGGKNKTLLRKKTKKFNDNILSTSNRQQKQGTASPTKQKEGKCGRLFALLSRTNVKGRVEWNYSVMRINAPCLENFRKKKMQEKAKRETVRTSAKSSTNPAAAQERAGGGLTDLWREQGDREKTQLEFALGREQTSRISEKRFTLEITDSKRFLPPGG